jgi:hypothetical protein
MKLVILILAVSTVANSFVLIPIHPMYPSSLSISVPTTTKTTPWLTTSELVTTTTTTRTCPFRSSSITRTSLSRLFGGGFGGKTSSSSGGGGGKGEEKKRSKEVAVKLKPKQQWDRYLSFKNEPKIRVAVRVVGDDVVSDEWLEVGRVRTTMKHLTELAVARQRAIIAEVSNTGEMEAVWFESFCVRVMYLRKVTEFHTIGFFLFFLFFSFRLFDMHGSMPNGCTHCKFPPKRHWSGGIITTMTKNGRLSTNPSWRKNPIKWRG